MMKILILTQYFPPEVGAPQNRLFELSQRLKNKGIEVTVLTSMPNYPSMVIHAGYEGKKYVYEDMDGIHVHRSSIYVSSDRSISKRLHNYFSFVISSWQIRRKISGKFDYLFCESPPLFLGISARLLCRYFNAKLIFNVSDLWPESAAKLGLVKNKWLLRLATWLEEYLYRSSHIITGQTQGIVNDISKRFPGKLVYWLPNGVDLEYYDPSKYDNNWRVTNGFNNTDFILLYAGIIGYAQGLEVILETALKLKNRPDIKFILLGDGPQLAFLKGKAEAMALANVHFISPVPKSKMPFIISSIDAAIIPLKRLDLFKGAIPSKIFEALAMEKPILLGVEGEAKDLFIDQGNCGLAFKPESTDELESTIIKLYSDEKTKIHLGQNGRLYVQSRFNRNNIASEFIELLANYPSTRKSF